VSGRHLPDREEARQRRGPPAVHLKATVVVLGTYGDLQRVDGEVDVGVAFQVELVCRLVQLPETLNRCRVRPQLR
jgi:hypothetical protein